MKLTILLISFIIASLTLSAQFGYKHQLETNNGVNINYKIVHSKHFDKSSPAQIRLKFENINEYPVNVVFEIEYSTDMTKRYGSGKIEVCIPANSAKFGTVHGLAFELNTNDIEIFNGDNAEWEFVSFVVTQTEDCKLNKE